MLIEENKGDLQQLFDIVERETKKTWLEGNSKEAEAMVGQNNKDQHLY